MTFPLILASTSPIRAQLLRAAGLQIETVPPRVDEDAIRHALEADGAGPRDLADALAEMKARKVAEKYADRVVLGCDQVLEFKGRALSKVTTRDAAADLLAQLSGQAHDLLSAAVVYENARPVWRTVATVRLTMHPLTPAEIDAYLDRTWPDVAGAVGCYMLEAEGARLFSAIEGDYFTVLGLPLLPLLSYFRQRAIFAL